MQEEKKKKSEIAESPGCHRQEYHRTNSNTRHQHIKPEYKPCRRVTQLSGTRASNQQTGKNCSNECEYVNTFLACTGRNYPVVCALLALAEILVVTTCWGPSSQLTTEERKTSFHLSITGGD
jgi:hypothetical protein